MCPKDFANDRLSWEEALWQQLGSCGGEGLSQSGAGQRDQNLRDRIRKVGLMAKVQLNGRKGTMGFSHVVP